jgi:hypothetical protein
MLKHPRVAADREAMLRWRHASRIPWGLLLIEALVVLMAVGAGWLVSNLS